jgi:hypothetical protein
MVNIYFRLFLELDLVCQTGMQQDSYIWINVLFVKQGSNMIKIFESLDLVLSNMDLTWLKYLNPWILFCQTWMHHDSNMLFWSWEAWHIIPTYEQILTITHH